MFAKDLQTKSVQELNEQLESLLKEQFQLKFQNKMGQLQNVAQLKKVRRDIARINTVLAAKKDGE